MATKKVHIGSVGPLLYDDANAFPDGTPHGIVTEGVLRTSRVPTVNGDVLRFEEMPTAGIAPADAQYLVLAVNADLTVERVFTAGNFLIATDNGAGLTFVLAVDALDEDTMVSNSDTKLATQQSIKAYVDTQIAGAPGSEYWQNPVKDKDLTTPPT